MLKFSQQLPVHSFRKVTFITTTTTNTTVLLHIIMELTDNNNNLQTSVYTNIWYQKLHRLN